MTGPAGAPIAVNFVDTGDTIDSDGTKRYYGTIQQGSEGSNQQYWTVGGDQAAPFPLSFVVQPVPLHSCGEYDVFDGSPDTMYVTDHLHRWMTYITYSRYPETLNMVADIDPANFTCTVGLYGAEDASWPEFFRLDGVNVINKRVQFTLNDTGCNWAGDPRDCEWYNHQWLLGYPAFSQKELWVEYLDRYDNQLYHFSTYACMWVDYQLEQ